MATRGGKVKDREATPNVCFQYEHVYYASHVLSLTLSYACILQARASAARTKEASEAVAAARTIAQAMRRTGDKGNEMQLNRHAEEAYKAACVDATAWLKVCVYKSSPFLIFPYFFI
jgi:hypothetical protein